MARMSAGTPATTRGDDTARIAVFEQRLDTHLENRRLLDRADTAIEPEPATLAQTAAFQRLIASIDAADAACVPHADGLRGAADSLIASMVALLSSRTALHVADWREAHAALESVAALVETVTAAHVRTSAHQDVAPGV